MGPLAAFPLDAVASYPGATLSLPPNSSLDLSCWLTCRETRGTLTAALALTSSLAMR